MLLVLLGPQSSFSLMLSPSPSHPVPLSPRSSRRFRWTSIEPRQSLVSFIPGPRAPMPDVCPKRQQQQRQGAVVTVPARRRLVHLHQQARHHHPRCPTAASWHRRRAPSSRSTRPSRPLQLLLHPRVCLEKEARRLAPRRSPREVCGGGRLLPPPSSRHCTWTRASTSTQQRCFRGGPPATGAGAGQRGPASAMSHGCGWG